MEQNQETTTPTVQNTKFCQHCGAVIMKEAVICTSCGCQVAETQSAAPNIVVTNVNTNTNTNVNHVNGGGSQNARNKWVAFWLCVLLGYLGAHKFYEGKTTMGIVYLCTIGLFGIGWIIDSIALFFKPNPYYV